MAVKVAGDLYESITGQLFEIGRQLRQPSGYPFDPEKLKKYLQDAVEGDFDGATSTPTFLRDMRKEGWTLVEDVKDDPVPASQLELVSFLNRGESYVGGEEMKKRASEKKAALGQRQAEHLLEHQEEIPSEWQNYYLTFPGTVWRTPYGGLHVPCLHWSGDQWGLGFDWLGHDWYDDDRLLRPSK